jgi:VCBS repeat-containing protein
VLGNDTDPEGQPLTAVLQTGPTEGSLTLNSNGNFTYTPNTNFNGTDSFTYFANDGTANSNLAATVTITVGAVNDLHVATDDAYTIDEDILLSVAAPGVLANDTDPEGQPLTAVLQSGPGSGSLTLNSNGSFTYTPNADFSGTDSFTYFANDGTANSNLAATVIITVNQVPDPPTAVDDSYSTNEDTTLNIASPGVLANDNDPDGDSLSAVLESGPTDGSLILNSNGSFNYTPNTNFHLKQQWQLLLHARCWLQRH